MGTGRALSPLRATCRVAKLELTAQPRPEKTRSTSRLGLKLEEGVMCADPASSVPEPIPQDAPGGFAAAEPLPDLIRRIVREELRPIHRVLEEIRDHSS
jgi:hypothetical protein